jgi:hypothetical protein
LLNNDATKGMLKGMMKDMLSKKAPEGTIAADGRSYSNPAVGLSVILPPSAKKWRISKAPMPLALCAIQPNDGRLGVNIVQQPLPMAMPVESVGPFVEMGVGMMIKNYKRIKSGLIGTGASQGWELEYTGTPPDGGDVLVHAVQRVYLRNGGMMVVSALGDADEWRVHESAVRAIFDAIVFTAPVAAPENGNEAEKAAPAAHGSVDKTDELKSQLKNLIENDVDGVKAAPKSNAQDADELKADLKKLRQELDRELKRAD